MDKQKIIERIELLKKQRAQHIAVAQAKVIDYNQQIETLAQERDAFATEANKQVGEFNGRIAELELALGD